MEYDIRLTIAHRYEMPAGNGRHVVRVVPRALVNRQWIKAFALTVSPRPAERSDRVDFFGNLTTTVAYTDPHDKMVFEMSCRVELLEQSPLIDTSPKVSALAQEVTDLRNMSPMSALHFLGPSPRLLPNSEIASFARAAQVESGSVADTVIAIGRALHSAMTFDPTVTTVDTDPVDAFRQKGGVCQDYAQIMILALRSLGIPAGYVSGYLRTIPPEGTERLEGADAMHAWVKAWCGASLGWIEYDPTNACLAGLDHIVVGYGRDYSDVSPVVGHLRSAGKQKATQSVDVICLQ